MPLLQGQPFKLIKPPDILPLDSEVYTIQHTGEKFLNKSDYEDRLALYSQNIWTCQCTGHTGMTHKEAWMSEAKCRVAAKNAVPYALQKPLLSLVHHSLSPLEQLIDAASILCHSQYHVGEDVLLLYPKQISVKIVNCKENSKMFMESCKEPHHSLQNGLPSGKEATSLLNGNSNGMAKSDGVDLSPGKENQVKDVYSSKEESSNKRDMLPKLYDVKTLEDKKLIEDVPSKNLLRPYKVPSKDQIRLFIRSCALRHRGSTCTPWVVSEDLVKKFNISNKLPSLFLSSPKPNLSSSSKRKAQSPVIEVVKRPKADLSFKKQTTSEVSSVIVKTDIKEKPVTQLKMMPQPKKEEGTKTSAKNENPQHSTQPVSQNNKISLKSKSPSWGTITKHPLSMGKPKILPKPSSTSTPSPAPSSSLPTPRKRGRPPLSKEEKERNRLLRQKTLIDLSNKISNPDSLGALNIIKVTTNTEPSLPPQIPFSTGSTTTSSYLQPASSVVSTPYRSPVKRATTPESIMKLPVMKRFVHEYKTIKGVLGQFRRYAYTMDLVLSKLSPAQIDMIPDEALKKDLNTRQKKVQDKKFFEKLTPEEKKQFLKDKARTVALERWKERKLKNLKVEDKLVHGLAPLPAPTLVETPQLISNAMFGDIVMITDFIKCFRELLLGEEKFKIPSTHLMEAAVAGPEGYQIITDLICCFLPTIIHDDISKNCKEIGVPISSIPISYQTAHELARLCLTKQEEEESFANIEDNYLLGKEKNELSDDLLSKLECCELWELNCQEIICVLKALVHKALATAAISVYVEEIEEKVLQTLRERRKFLKQVQKEQKAVIGEEERGKEA
ncbi:Tyrosine-protein kinase BAZ1B [Armadillidium vulgare]|nr:Tyrosine-protein kinase BAZ1B [Armadillidium vulgare]